MYYNKHLHPPSRIIKIFESKKQDISHLPGCPCFEENSLASSSTNVTVKCRNGYAVCKKSLTLPYT